jgi:glycosyltransferase involved in cell wall biosynthesis
MKEGISVCMCTYNGEEHISKQLQSIVDQTMRPNEIVIVDDASSDKTVQIINQFILKYDYIKLYINNNNAGVNYSFLRAIRKSKNDIIIFSDQDDYWYADRINSINNAFKESFETVMVSTNAHIYDNEKYTGSNVHDVYKPTKSFLKVFYKNRFIGAQIAIKRKVAIKIINIPKYTYYDHLIALLSLKSGHVSCISKPLSKYIRHNQTVTEIGVPGNYFESIFSRYFIFLFFIRKMLNEQSSNCFLIKENVKSVVRSIKRRGLVKTAIFSINELLFDIRFGTDTRSKVSSSSIINQGMNNVAQPYQGTNFTIIKSIFQKLAEIVDLKKVYMVDYGAGMGRVILSGLYYGVYRVEGVEFDKELYGHCNENINRFCKNREISRDRVKCLFIDAQLYKIPKGVNIFFLYNPFSSPVIDKVVENISLYAESQKNEIIVVYVNPVCRSVFLEKNFILLIESNEEVDFYRYAP